MKKGIINYIYCEGNTSHGCANAATYHRIPSTFNLFRCVYVRNCQDKSHGSCKEFERKGQVRTFNWLNKYGEISDIVRGNPVLHNNLIKNN
jgi:hypothetical protein